MKLSRRKWLSRAIVYGGSAGGFGYGSAIEKRWLDVTRQVIPLSPQHAALDGLKIAVMGDFHHDDFGDSALVRRAVKAINGENVDFVFLVGDYISNEPEGIVTLCEELSDLRSTLGTFGIMGNHDTWHMAPILLTALEDAGIRMLINQTHEFEKFAIAGLDSYWAGNPDLSFALKEVDPNKPVILGWHEPDSFDTYTDPRLVLQVSGHTHGGQICAPLYGPLLLPEYGRNYPYGHYRREHSSLFVTRGIGTLDIPARFLCRPEVALLRLVL